MIVQSTRGKKVHVTSSYFNDLRVIKKSEFETDYRDLRRNSSFDIERLKHSYAIQKMILFRKGCLELSEWARQLQPTQNNLEKYVTDYMGEDYEPFDGEIDMEEMIKKDA